MDFLKNNLFYVILVAGILVISVPSFILASQRQESIRKAISDANTVLTGIQMKVKNLKPVTKTALDEAQRFKKEWEAQRTKAHELLRQADRHMDEDFLVPPAKSGLTPDPIEYRNAYNSSYDGMVQALVKANLLNAKKPAFSSKAYFAERLPTPEEIRISQKQYWILKELAAAFASSDSLVKEIDAVMLDINPASSDAANQPDETGRFWVYPIRMDFRIDFRSFPLFLEKLLEGKDVMFFVDSFTVSRAFDESKPVYAPIVAVTLYCQVWDYISTSFEEKNLKDWLAARGKKGGAAAPAPAAGRGPASGRTPARRTAPAEPESEGSGG